MEIPETDWTRRASGYSSPRPSTSVSWRIGEPTHHDSPPRTEQPPQRSRPIRPLVHFLLGSTVRRLSGGQPSRPKRGSLWQSCTFRPLSGASDSPPCGRAASCPPLCGAPPGKPPRILPFSAPPGWQHLCGRQLEIRTRHCPVGLPCSARHGHLLSLPAAARRPRDPRGPAQGACGGPREPAAADHMARVPAPTLRSPTQSATGCCTTRTESCYRAPRGEKKNQLPTRYTTPASLRSDHYDRSR